MTFELRFGAPLESPPAPAQTGDSLLDYLTLLVTLIGALAWPMALVLLVLIFRKQLVKLVARTKAVSGPAGISATFADELEKAKEAADQTLSAEPLRESAPLEVDDPFLKLAETYPEAAVLAAYDELETFLTEAMGLKGAVVVPITSLMIALSNLKLIPSDTFELFNRIRNARNLAVHGRSRLTPGEAIEFRAVARSLIEAIRPIHPAVKELAHNLSKNEVQRRNEKRPSRY
ncbi:hypothetical protein EOC93_31600 [Mesorhizobium sp. M6A.T.Ce.TU.002.03.1.1]|uniref:hypothetical protein n=1 Tax=Mesorhizobium sp. M6A.T.Ce.TU.002.03.1.1 TaxID=2496782 RepID=UPI000FCB1108|nr:hypothetical protein [Mesorhizobium sp. M6A.T.Ce.TU.002.03.1.1]RUU31880.1 hypothetical protein EOC93_31600 [Mesorhizobium sp. M6A.T.Ce.TU.002.03.1.1]RWQ42899.1 MAG: hypothetical protein EOS21_07305 [Mesorhizobium sp.]